MIFLNNSWNFTNADIIIFVMICLNFLFGLFPFILINGTYKSERMNTIIGMIVTIMIVIEVPVAISTLVVNYINKNFVSDPCIITFTSALAMLIGTFNTFIAIKIIGIAIEEFEKTSWKQFLPIKKNKQHDLQMAKDERIYTRTKFWDN